MTMNLFSDRSRPDELLWKLSNDLPLDAGQSRKEREGLDDFAQ